MSNAIRSAFIGVCLLSWLAFANSIDGQTTRASGIAPTKDTGKSKQLVWIKPHFVKRHGRTKWIPGEYKWRIWIPPKEVTEDGHKKTIPGKYIYEAYQPPR
jgi:hypothetical protein